VTIRKPIFVVGHPRSGTSLMRSILERNEDVWTCGREGKPLWEKKLHPRNGGWQSNALSEGDATPELAGKLKAALIAAARKPGAEWSVADKLDFLDFMGSQGVNPYYYDVPFRDLAARFTGPPPGGPATTRDGGELDEITPFCFPPRGARPSAEDLAKGIRLVEKSIQSCFRIPFLRRLFPDATYVFVVREPKASIASLIEAWLDPRMFFSYKVPCVLDIRGYSDVFPWGKEWWNLSLPPGWQDLSGLRLAEVCAHSWRIHNEAVRHAIDEVLDPADVVVVRYEDLRADPAAVMEKVAEVVELPYCAAWRRRELPVVMTQTPPDVGKWRRHEREVFAVLPIVAELAAGFGYAGSA
jgi:Sulfotransferase family